MDDSLLYEYQVYITNEDDIKDYVDDSNNNFLNFLGDYEQEKRQISEKVIDSITMLRNLAGSLIPEFNYVGFFLKNVEKCSLLKNIFRLFDSQFENLYNRLENNDEIVDELTLIFILRTLQFWHNLLKLKFIWFKDDQLMDEFCFVVDRKYYKRLLNLYRFDKFDERANFFLQRSSYVFDAVLYVGVSNKQFLTIFTQEKEQMGDLWDSLLDHVRLEVSRWSLWVLFFGFKEEGFVEKLYSNASIENKILLMDIFMEFLDDECEKEKDNCLKKKAFEPQDCQNLSKCNLKPFSENFIISLIEYFQNKIGSSLEMGINENTFNSPEMQMVCKMSSFLLKISSFEIYNKLFKDNKKLFELLIDLLNAFQTLAKAKPDSIFGIKSRIGISDEDKNIENPIFGFKRNIIGLIANCLFKNPTAQEYLTKSGGLIALMNCTRIDDNNPFIMQWSIFAIRNALEKNHDNQYYVANMKRQNFFDDELKRVLY